MTGLLTGGVARRSVDMGETGHARRLEVMHLIEATITTGSDDELTAISCLVAFGAERSHKGLRLTGDGDGLYKEVAGRSHTFVGLRYHARGQLARELPLGRVSDLATSFLRECTHTPRSV